MAGWVDRWLGVRKFKDFKAFANDPTTQQPVTQKQFRWIGGWVTR
ncbi:hypothetical protein BpOF4_06600 [Alkalihalophilus pseudofirmus OF4]|uniref:Uncharacterized protein n=1 Tax=Alkalihalophilus pseudofirmus (strain ATCC BAA-2126 / JCM 17055 / OF4) TaxID=398511 RepID=D3G0A3_ALKPO|nr:hypothetical protein BpOF4_06600 [Alkalihalophilus pseudofirmus OF4]